jgi:hypothetical protein
VQFSRVAGRQSLQPMYKIWVRSIFFARKTSCSWTQATITVSAPWLWRTLSHQSAVWFAHAQKQPFCCLEVSRLWMQSSFAREIIMEYDGQGMTAKCQSRELLPRESVEDEAQIHTAIDSQRVSICKHLELWFRSRRIHLYMYPRRYKSMMGRIPNLNVRGALVLLNGSSIYRKVTHKRTSHRAVFALDPPATL